MINGSQEDGGRISDMTLFAEDWWFLGDEKVIRDDPHCVNLLPMVYLVIKNHKAVLDEAFCNKLVELLWNQHKDLIELLQLPKFNQGHSQCKKTIAQTTWGGAEVRRAALLVNRLKKLPNNFEAEKRQLVLEGLKAKNQFYTSRAETCKLVDEKQVNQILLKSLYL